VLLIIDGGYLLACMKDNANTEVERLFFSLAEKLKVDHFYEKWFLNGRGHYNFNNKLKTLGCRVELFDMKRDSYKCSRCNYYGEKLVQKGVDVAIATLMLEHAYENKCDEIVLLAGDGDFLKALSTVRDKLNKTIYIAGFHGSVSSDLQQFGRTIWIDELLKADSFQIFSKSHVVGDINNKNNNDDIKESEEAVELRQAACKVLLDTILRLDTFRQLMLHSCNTASDLIDFTQKILCIVQEQQRLEEQIPIDDCSVEV